MESFKDIYLNTLKDARWNQLEAAFTHHPDETEDEVKANIITLLNIAFIDERFAKYADDETIKVILLHLLMKSLQNIIIQLLILVRLLQEKLIMIQNLNNMKKNRTIINIKF